MMAGKHKENGKAAVTRSEIQPRVYLERGHPVEVLTRWGPGGGPRNVLIRRETGELVVRPFRGLWHRLEMTSPLSPTTATA